MQSILQSTPDSKAVKELGLFAIASLVAAAVSMVVFWWLAIVGLGFGARAILISFHKANKGTQTTPVYRWLAITAVIISTVGLVM